ncbi:MAG TPA: ATPase domain-containing protein [Herpetosiphonaceae bacterium]
MAKRQTPASNQLHRIPTDIEPLDTVLGGGFFAGSVYIMIGVPGSGKTTMANHICHNVVARGGTAVCLTVLTETHSRLFAYLRQFAFFRDNDVGSAVVYVNGYREFKSGLNELLELTRQIMLQYRPTLLLIDSLPFPPLRIGADADMDDFIHDLQVSSEAHQCTTLITTPAAPDHRYSHAITLVDGHLELQHDIPNAHVRRHLIVHKFRGSVHSPARHAFAITSEGITMYDAASQPDGPDR